MLGLGYDEENGKHKMKFCPPTSVRDKEGGTAPVKSLSSLYWCEQNRLSHIIKSELKNPPDTDENINSLKKEDL